MVQRPGKNSTRAERDAFNKAKADERRELSKRSGNLQKGRDRDLEQARKRQEEKQLTKDLPREAPAPIQLNQPQEERKEPTAAGFATAAAIGAGAGLALTFAAPTTIAAATARIALGFGAKRGAIKAAETVGRTSFQTTLKGERAVIVRRFATNQKSRGLTNSLLKKAGLSTRALIAIGASISTYPFAIFEIAESTDKVGIAMFTAAQAGDEEEVIRLSEILDEMLDLNVWEKIIFAIPFANVAGAAFKNIKAAIVGAKSMKNRAEKELLRKQEGGESEFAQERREGDEAATQRRLKEQELDSQYFALIREKRFDEAEELLQSRINEEETETT